MSHQFWKAVDTFFGLMNLAGDGELTPFEARATFSIACNAVMSAISSRGDNPDPNAVHSVAESQCSRIFDEMDPERRGYITIDHFKEAYKNLLTQHVEEEVIYIDIVRSIKSLIKWHKARRVDKSVSLKGLLDLAYARWKAPVSMECTNEEGKSEVSEEVEALHFPLNGPHSPEHRTSETVPVYNSVALETIDDWFEDSRVSPSSQAIDSTSAKPHASEHLIPVATEFKEKPALCVKSHSRALARLIYLAMDEQFCPKAQIYRAVAPEDFFFPKLSLSPAQAENPESTTNLPATEETSAPLKKGATLQKPAQAPSRPSLISLVRELRSNSSIANKQISPARLTHIFSRLLDLCIPSLAIAEAILAGNEVFEDEEELPEERNQAGSTQDTASDSDEQLEELTNIAKSKFHLLPVGFSDHQYRDAAVFQRRAQAPKSQRNRSSNNVPAMSNDLLDYPTPATSTRPFIYGVSRGLPPRGAMAALPRPSNGYVSQSTTIPNAIGAARRMQTFMQNSEFAFREDDEDEDEANA